MLSQFKQQQQEKQYQEMLQIREKLPSYRERRRIIEVSSRLTIMANNLSYFIDIHSPDYEQPQLLAHEF